MLAKPVANKIPGLHHVTVIASDPQRNLDFYAGLLGLRFVKRTVNFDDPGTYHFYFGDQRGTPGTFVLWKTSLYQAPIKSITTERDSAR